MVLKVVKQLDYHPNAVAKSLQMQKTHTFGIMIPDISNPYYAEIVRGMQDETERNGYSILIQNTDRNKDKTIQNIYLFREKLVDGIIFSGGIIEGEKVTSALGNLKERAVVIGRQRMDCPAIRVNNIENTVTTVGHLVSLGHRRIGFLGGSYGSTTMQDRFSGYKRGIKKYKCESDRNLIAHADLTIEGGYEKAKEILERSNSPTAFVAANDQLAIGAIKAAKDLGFRIPGDIAVVGFDNIPFSRYFDPAVTTVDIPRYDMGAASVRILLDVINKKPVPPITWFSCRLIVRGSTTLN